MAIKRDKYDKIISDLVRDAAGHQCARCGKQDGKMDCAHNLGRRATWTRYDPRNLLCLCFSCHSLVDSNAYEKIQTFTKIHGEENCELMRYRFNQAFKPPKGFKDEIYAHYKEEQKRLKSERMENCNILFNIEIPPILR